MNRATLAFGVAHLHLVKGREAEGDTLFRQIVESGRDDQWWIPLATLEARTFRAAVPPETR